MVFRLSLEKDREGIVRMIVDHALPNWPLHLPETNEEKVAEKIRQVMDEGVIYVFESKGEIVGSIGLLEVDFLFSDETFITDIWLYVKKENRSYKAARKLLMFARNYAKMLEKPLIMGHIYNENIERKDVLYQRLGLKRIGGFYAEGI